MATTVDDRSVGRLLGDVTKDLQALVRVETLKEDVQWLKSRKS